MSFILDALKKSETERQQQGSAEFATVPVGTARSGTPRWIWVLGALLAINVAAILGLMLRPDTPPVVEASPVPDVPQQEPVATYDEPAVAAISFEDRVAEARNNQAEIVVEEPAAKTKPVVMRHAAAENVGVVTDDLPSLVELRAAGRIQVPELHLDIHVFSYVPAERFVFINMNKATEGSVLDEGPRVEEITVDGVVLEYQGQSFKLTRE